MTKSDLLKRLSEAEAEFELLAKQKAEASQKIDQIESRQKQLQGVYQTLTILIDTEKETEQLPSNDKEVAERVSVKVNPQKGQPDGFPARTS